MRPKVTLEQWAAAKYNPPPSLYTLRKWARDCWIYPLPEKVGRTYYVDPDARFVGRDYMRIGHATT